MNQKQKQGNCIGILRPIKKKISKKTDYRIQSNKNGLQIKTRQKTIQYGW